MTRRAHVLAAALVALAACSKHERVPFEPAPGARRESARLARLGAELWEEQMRSSPVWATFLGDRRFDDELGDPSEKERERSRAAKERMLAEARSIDRAALSADERITLDVVDHLLGTALATEAACRTWSWSVDQMYGPQVWIAGLPQRHLVKEWRHAESLLARYLEVDGYFAAHVENLRTGMREGRTAARVNVERVLKQVEEQLAVAPEESTWVTDALAALPADIAEDRRQAYREGLIAATRESIHPALSLYRDFLRDELLPKARPDTGIGAFPGAAACYAARVRQETGTGKTPDEIHALGLAEVARIQREMRSIAGLPEGAPLRPWFDALARRGDAFPASREAVLEHNRKLVARAQAALPRAFGRLPETAIEVTALEPFREKDAPAGYYQSAPKDRSRPAFYYSNTYRPETRPLWNMAALAFHEAVPGHHLQIALSEENAAIPEFQRRLGQTAFVEGWALYAERLAGELGLYETPEEKIGALNYEVWRAVRLVVDTGLHAKGWSRERALAYFLENTGHTEGEAANEIDRYLMWPGQALAYKMGELEILEMREQAKRTLGPRFDLRAFHDRLLSHGAIPLSAARRDLREWASAERRTPR